MKITRRSQTSEDTVDPTHFDGSVTRRDYGSVDEPEGTALHVRFPAGARTHWHSHPHGQVLYVTDGTGRVATRDGAVERLTAGDLVYAPPDEEHWHGATEEASVEHLALSFGDTAWAKPVED
jgi:quercetin dioxygenase-like cupin family protein